MDWRKSVILLFTILTIAGAALFFCTPINYNMMDYLPKEANSTRALALMESEFEQPIPNLNVMVENVSLSKAVALKGKIAQADSVREILWLDDTLDLKIPLEIQDTDVVEAYYKDGCALYMVTVENGRERAAIASIREQLGMDCSFSGSASDQADAQNTAASEALKGIGFLIPLTLVILLLVTESWIEPVFYLATLGAAVLINLGLGYFTGSMSFVTLAAAPVLQLAVSLDYAVFLSHSFTGFQEQGMEGNQAMRLAIRASIKSISASMLTTLFGFIALLFMKFRIGADMGLSLVRGVLMSFLCVLVLFPALLLLGKPVIERTKHRRLIPSFASIGTGIGKIRIPVFCLLFLMIVPAFLGQASNEYFYGVNETTVPGSGADQIEQKFGVTNTMVLMVPAGDESKETGLCRALGDLPHVTAVTSYATMVSSQIPTAYLDSQLVKQFYSENYARILLSLDCPAEGKEAFEVVEQVRALSDDVYPGGCYTCGQSANLYDVKVFGEEDNLKILWITIGSIYLILFLTTQNYLMPLFLILTIECSIWLNMSIPYFMGRNLNYVGYLIVSAIQMGATVDYAILLTNTYLENRKVLEKREAMTKTLGEIFSSILISSATLSLSGFCLKLASSNEVVKIMGTLIGRGTILAVVMVLFLLPVFLLCIDRVIPYTTIGKEKSVEKGRIEKR